MALKELDFRKVDLNLLVVFHALMQEHSVQRAAQRLYLGASAVSMALRRLRELFNDELLVRVGPKMEPTTKALELLPQVVALLEGAHRLVYQADAFNPNDADHVFRLGAAESCETHVVATVLADLRQLAPRASLVVRAIDATRAITLLDSGDIDVAVGHLEGMPAHHNSELLVHHGFACLFDPAQVGDFDTLSLDAYLAFEHIFVSQQGELSGPVDVALKAMGHARRVVACASRFSALPSWLSRSPLIASLPLHVAKEMAQAHPLEYRPLPFTMGGYDISMGWHRRLDVDPAASWFRSLVKRSAHSVLLPATQPEVVA